MQSICRVTEMTNSGPTNLLQLLNQSLTSTASNSLQNNNMAIKINGISHNVSSDDFAEIFKNTEQAAFSLTPEDPANIKLIAFGEVIKQKGSAANPGKEIPFDDGVITEPVDWLGDHGLIGEEKMKPPVKIKGDEGSVSDKEIWSDSGELLHGANDDEAQSVKQGSSLVGSELQQSSPSSPAEALEFRESEHLAMPPVIPRSVAEGVLLDTDIAAQRSAVSPILDSSKLPHNQSQFNLKGMRSALYKNASQLEVANPVAHTEEPAATEDGELEALVKTRVKREGEFSGMVADKGVATKLLKSSKLNDDVDLPVLLKSQLSTSGKNNTLTTVAVPSAQSTSSLNSLEPLIPIITTPGITASSETNEARTLQNLTVSSEFTQGLNLKREFAPNLAHRIQWMFSQALSSAEILMDPPEMGPLSVKIQHNNGETSILFQVANASTKEVLDDSLPKLKEMLAEQGINLGEAQVQHQNDDQENGDQESGQQSKDIVETDEDSAKEQGIQHLVSEGIVDVYS